jgi:hypothetical protein
VDRVHDHPGGRVGGAGRRDGRLCRAARARGVLVAVPLLVGLLVAWFVIGEIVVPH